jgi:hypothetical protein
MSGIVNAPAAATNAANRSSDCNTRRRLGCWDPPKGGLLKCDPER